MPYLLRSGCLANYAEVARSAGLNPHQLLANASLSRYALLDTDIRIPVEAVSQLLEASAAASGQIDFGLRMAESRQLADLGPLALAMREAPSLRMALDSMERYLRLHNEALSLHIDRSSGGLVTVRAEMLRAGDGGLRQSMELVVGAIHRALHCLLGRLHGVRLVPHRVYFTHAAPANPATHTRLFGTKPSFNQEFDGIMYRAEDLEVPLKTYDPSRVSEARRHLDSMLAERAESVTDNVRRLVACLLPQGKCSADEVARQLGIDRRTVHRKLRLSGRSYLAILQEVRTDLAMRYIANVERPLSEIAGLLGFTSLCVFSRWFAMRFGCSVSEWRGRRANPAQSTSAR
ncbi:AraC family transcriptional regulator (plasmid) [Cupriavidus taiwanensis]|uniref:AraC family transcriptional regulator n=1 Tax=Cupriavidus taiwanensis TaxID=164546 RepID=A0A375I899_9BURK|nr:AraC family transcriptional regulator [Cupriavidus taiwanensis]SPK70051.1 AraC family transcriptional regulator [Cupriavidus taiwanensis]SPK74858.1 AraC family transcriptional regulator [Cupriavidus taiwanensis]